MNVPRDFNVGRPRIRVLNPQRIDRVFVLAANEEIRSAAEVVDQRLAYCEVTILSDPSELATRLHAQTFVLFVDEGGMVFLDQDEFKAANPFGTVVLLSSDIRVGAAPTQTEIEQVCPLAKQADLIFYVNDGDCRPTKVLPALVRYVEDKHNIEYHKRARRFIFLVVDDEVRWFSQFLPVLYRIIGQRASVMLARTFEQAREVVHDHGSDTVCLITDMLFPKNGVVSAEAGRELVLLTKQRHPRIPIIIASKEDRGRSLENVALILPKGDPGAVETLDQYVHDFTGLGDFLFYVEGKLWRRVSKLSELREAVADAPVEMIDEYAAKDYFSTWLYMHGFRRVADFLRLRRDHGDALREVLLAVLDEQLAIVAEQELVLVNRRNETVARVKNVEDLAQIFEEVDDETLTAYSADDVFSMWAMIKGCPRLADQLRPIQGEGQPLRDELREVLRLWLATR